MKAMYLIQRANISNPLCAKGARFSKAITMDYMGSSEFEFGALPKSMRRLQAAAKEMRTSIRMVVNLREDDKPLRVYSHLTDEEFATYREWLHLLRSSKPQALKENARFQASRVRYKFNDEPDFWWDIENDVMFTFNKKAMNRLPDWLAASWAFMDAMELEREADEKRAQIESAVDEDEDDGPPTVAPEDDQR